jgi:hypothetical protein
VPQDLRAVNLAAFEVVDYVVIDKNAKPIENIRIIQPDYFAKGFEYTASGMPVKTAEEADVLQSYGGEIIFTPGDIVYSSSNLIDLAPPSIKLEKLQIVMERSGTFDKLRQTAYRCSRKETGRADRDSMSPPAARRRRSAWRCSRARRNRGRTRREDSPGRHARTRMGPIRRRPARCRIWNVRSGPWARTVR